jgi:hypothetical protein
MTLELHDGIRIAGILDRSPSLQRKTIVVVSDQHIIFVGTYMLVASLGCENRRGGISENCLL